jgi:hypothetical protein
MKEFNFKKEPAIERGNTYSVCLRGARRFAKRKSIPLKYNGKEIGWARISLCKQFRFCDIMPFDCEWNYDPSARTFEGLQDAMYRAYSEFDTNEIVTLVFFTVL